MNRSAYAQNRQQTTRQSRSYPRSDLYLLESHENCSSATSLAWKEGQDDAMLADLLGQEFQH